MTEFTYKTKPWQHQIDALKCLDRNPAFMLAYDMATGKSKVVVDFINNKGFKKILIVCPLCVIDVWPKQFSLHSEMEFEILPLNKGSITKRKKQAETYLFRQKVHHDPAVIVINYESAWRSEFGAFIMGTHWDLVVLDESHRIKSPGGKASRFFGRLGRIIKNKICLTGTPMPHSPLDVYGQYRFLNSNIYGKSFQTFKMNYAIMGGYPINGRQVQVVGFKNTKDLNEKFYSIAHRVMRQDVMDLPETIDVERTFELNAKSKKIYKELEEHFITALDEGIVTASNALVKLLRLQQITSGFLTPEGGEAFNIGDGKANQLLDIFEDLPHDEPVVVFCRFRYDLDQVIAAATKCKRKSSELSGRKNELETWQKGESNILAVQIQSGGVGIDLTRAHYAIYYSLGFSLGDYLQSRARIHRPGQAQKVTYIHLIAESTVDRKVIKALKKRENVIESTLKQMKGGDLNGLRKAQAIC